MACKKPKRGVIQYFTLQNPITKKKAFIKVRQRKYINQMESILNSINNVFNKKAYFTDLEFNLIMSDLIDEIRIIPKEVVKNISDILQEELQPFLQEKKVYNGLFKL